MGHTPEPTWEQKAISACTGMVDPAKEIAAMRKDAESWRACVKAFGIERGSDVLQRTRLQA